MNAPDRKVRQPAALARAIRAAIVVPALFALGVVALKEPAVIGFSVFGTFAHLVMVRYDGVGRKRSVQAAMLTIFGGAMVALGTFSSVRPWLAVGMTTVVGFVSERPAILRSRLATFNPAMLLAFMLAVVVPAPIQATVVRLEGWLLAGLASQAALMLIWISVGNGNQPLLNAAPASDNSKVRIGHAVSAGLAFGLAVLLTRLLKVEHGFWVMLGVMPMLAAKGASIKTFWFQQIGTLTGFAAAAVLVGVVGARPFAYWALLPVVIFLSVYLANAAGFVAGQAGFTLFAVVLFCILSPTQKEVGLMRVADIALGGAVSLAVGSLQTLGAASLPTMRTKAA